MNLPVALGLASLCLSFPLPDRGFAQVSINEIFAAPNERILRYDANGQPRLGTGPAWFDASFDSSSWSWGIQPFGFNTTGLTTNLTTLMQGKTSSLYLRKTFTVSSLNAASLENLRLNIDYNDGFIAFLNGKEIARARLGAPKTFVYADQPAFSVRPASPTGPEAFNLGPAANWLVAGNNLLAIQVANAAIDGKGDVKIDTTLELNNGILTTTEFTENFNNANGAIRTHTNNAGTITNTSAGAPPAGSWLADSPTPTSDATWAQLTIDQLLDTTGGWVNSGNLRVNLTGTGPTKPARVLGPPVSLATQWPLGSVGTTELGQTTLSFKYKAPEGFAANLFLEPVGGSAAAALPLGAITGSAPAPTADVAGWWRFENHTSGTTVVAGTAGAIMLNAPSLANPDIMTAASVTTGAAKYSADVPGAKILDPISGGVYANAFSFDATLANARFAAPSHAVLNTPSFTVECFMKLTGEPQGYDVFFRRQENGPLGDSAASSDFSSWQFDMNGGTGRTAWGLARFRVDLAGIPTNDFNRSANGARLLVDVDSGSGNPNEYPLDTATPNPKNAGDGINDASTNVWHHVALTYDGPTKRTTIYTDYAAGGNIVYNGTFVHPNGTFDFGKFTATAVNPPATGAYELKFDEVRYSGRVLATSEFLKVAAADAIGFNTYSTKLNVATPAEQATFANALNAASSRSFRPAIQLVDSSYATTPGKDMRLDDVSVTYTKQSAITPLIGAGQTFNYFVGMGEPSNGIWEPNLPAIPNNPSEAGQVAAFSDLPGFADWIELRNTGTSAVNLTGWYLTDDSANPTKWAFPAGTIIPGNGYKLVLCDENSDLPGMAYLHANFKLSEGGEKLRLYNGASKIDELEYPRQDHFHTYGRSSVDGTLGYFDVATPASANGAVNAIERCKTPDFFASDGITLITGGFYTGTQTIVISSTTVGGEIRYTLDGTEPTQTSTAYGAGPLVLAPAANDKTGRVVRARTFKNGAVASGTRSATFLINQNTALKGVPAMVFTGDGGRSFYKDSGVMAINGGTYSPDTWTAPLITDYSMGVMHGRAFERPMVMEWLRNDGLPGFNEEAGLRIASSPYSRPRLRLTGTSLSPWSADATQKPSFNIFFREDYDHSSLDYPFISQEYPVKNFDQLRPRAGKNDISNPFIKDELVRRIFNDMGNKSVMGQINTLYINGVYKGFFNTVERYREPYFQAHFDSKNAWDIRIIDTVEEGDNVDWNNLITAVNKDLSIKANYDDAMSKIDLDAVIDYYLLMTYVAMWDWPGNNWVASRERVPQGRWRLHIWDAEGAFGHGNVKPPNYDTIGAELRPGTAGGLTQLFKGIYASSEVKLRFADRINKWFFNGNILDDRDPVNCAIAKRKNEMTAGFAPLLSFTHGQTYSDSFWTNWTNATTANPNSGSWTTPMSNRRSFLFNTDNDPAKDISFRANGLWPATEPPTFSQHGGVIPQGYQLTISTNATVPPGSTVYYTTDGTDPRLYNGVTGASAQVYSDPFAIPGTLYTTVKTRVKNIATSEWSPVTEATFQFASVPATSANLVVRQIMYNPPDSLPAEVAAGVTDKDEFEYIELMAIGSSPVSLDNVKFIAGITFDFGNSISYSPVRAIGPGQSVVLVKSKSAFKLRYGNSLDAWIAGEYIGNLSNSGEQLWITGPDGLDADSLPDDIKRFNYDDDQLQGWAEAADGHGPALRLVNPAANQDHSLAASWTASTEWGGNPILLAAPINYANWLRGYYNTAERADFAITGPDADPDNDGLSNLFEFATGSRPDKSVSGGVDKGAIVSLENVSGLPHRTISLRITAQAAAALLLEGQISSDLTPNGWSNVPLLNTIDHGDGTITYQFQDPLPAGTEQRRFMRIRATAQ